MKKILFLCCFVGAVTTTKAQYHFYFGNIHSHTAYSDGTKDDAAGTPGDGFQYAKGAYHMDFLGIAEHNHYSYAENPGMHVADYAKGMFQADTANKDGYFVCMFGMEYGVIDNGGHLIVYGVPGLIGWEAGSGDWGDSNNYDIYNSKYNYHTLWTTINKYPHAFATMAHTQDDDYNNLLEGQYDETADNAIVGCAIRSGSAFSTTTDYSDRAATLYQDKFYAALSKGFHLGPTIDHDNHYTTFGKTNHGRTVVLSTVLQRDSIMAAYKAMRFYASDDWDAEVAFLANGHVMGETSYTPGVTQLSIDVNDPGNNTNGTDKISKIELYYGVPGSGNLPTVLTSTTSSNQLSYTHNTKDGDNYYYFAKITEADRDIIWTSPIWLKTGVDTTPPPSSVVTPTFDNVATLTVYPSPATQVINMNISVDRPVAGSIKIYDMLGREVYNNPTEKLESGKNSYSVNIQDLPQGNYIVVISEKNHRIAEGKFTKN